MGFSYGNSLETRKNGFYGTCLHGLNSQYFPGCTQYWDVCGMTIEQCAQLCKDNNFTNLNNNPATKYGVALSELECQAFEVYIPTSTVPDPQDRNFVETNGIKGHCHLQSFYPGTKISESSKCNKNWGGGNYNWYYEKIPPAPTPAPPSYKLSDQTCAQDETGKTLGPSDVGTVPTGSSAFTVDITFMPSTSDPKLGTLVRWGTVWGRSLVVRMNHADEVRLISNQDSHFPCKPGGDLRYKTHRYVASYDGTTRRAWMDGVKCGEDKPPKPNVDKQTPFCIGYLLAGGTDRSFKGTIENVHIYDSDVHNQLGLQA